MDTLGYIIAFESTHYAIMIEKKLKTQFKVSMIPTPREITASCGLSIKFKKEYFEEINSILIEFDKEMFDLYRIDLSDGNKIYNKI